jgi:hypothetical protein
MKLHAATLSLFTAAAITQAGPLKAQTISWIQADYSSGPSARENSGIAYDGAAGNVVLFGGASGQSIYGDTWIWNYAWRQVFPTSSPSPRQGTAFAYDGAAGNVLLFGGSPTAPVGAGTAFGDTWTWDGCNWTQQFPPTSPPARVWSQMVYDPVTRTVLLFGGTNTPDGNDSYSDTWEWNGLTRTWRELQPTSHPSARTTNPMAYDPRTRTVVLLGGVATNLTALNDTWTWNGINWVQHFPATSPEPRNGPGMVYDSALGAVVLFGGAVGICCSSNLNDTWVWNGVDWTEIYPATMLPQARNGVNIAYDPIYRVTLLFGGDTSGGESSGELDDTWFLALLP